MKINQLNAIIEPLRSALDYAVIARATNGEERAVNERLLLNRLRHAAENAGYVMYPANEKKADAA